MYGLVSSPDLLTLPTPTVSPSPQCIDITSPTIGGVTVPGGGAKGERGLGSGKSSAPSTGSWNVRNSPPEWLECNFGRDKNVIELN